MGRRGVRVTVVAPAPPGLPATTFAIEGAEVVLVPHDGRLLAARRMRPWRRAARPFVEAAQPDIVHGQNVITGGVVAADAASLARSIVTARGNARRDTLAAYSGVPARIRAALGDRLIGDVLDRVDMVVGVHPDWRVNLPAEPRRFTHIPNIVHGAFFRVERSPVAGRVLYCGGARRIKGFDVLEAAWSHVRAAVPGASLRLVGWPASAPALDVAETVGPVGAEQLADELARGHVRVIPSPYEVSPLLLADAWASGTPVIATGAGGMASLAPGAAVVVPPDKPRSLADAVVAVLEDTVDTTDNVSVGRARAEAHREEKVIVAHLELYDDVLRSP